MGHRREVPRLFLRRDQLEQLQEFIEKENDGELWKWWAQYMESSTRFEDVYLILTMESACAFVLTLSLSVGGDGVSSSEGSRLCRARALLHGPPRRSIRYKLFSFSRLFNSNHDCFSSQAQAVVEETNDPAAAYHLATHLASMDPPLV